MDQSIFTGKKWSLRDWIAAVFHMTHIYWKANNDVFVAFWIIMWFVLVSGWCEQIFFYNILSSLIYLIDMILLWLWISVIYDLLFYCFLIRFNR